MTAIFIPAPIGGWNARDALDKMESTDAVKLVNLIPRAGFVQSRGGYSGHAAGLGGAVETLIPWHGATEKLLAAANGKIFDVTSGTATEIGTGYTNNRWQYANHSTKIIMVNGDDAPKVYDGSSLTSASFAGSPGGFVAADMWGINSFKGRMFYWSQNA